MNKTALLDVDGVVADFTGDLLRAINSPLTEADITQWDLFALLGDRAEAARDVCKQDVFWRHMTLVPGAPEGVAKLQAEGYEIVWVTSPYYACVTWEDARRDWLYRTFGSGPRQMISTSLKYLVHGDVLIDDKPSHVTDWMKTTDGIAYLYDRPHNQDHDLVRFTWERYTTLYCLNDMWST